MAKKTKEKLTLKAESIEEYLTRGGVVKRLPSIELKPKVNVIRTTNQGGPAVFLSLEEADLFFGESSAKKTANPKKKVEPSISLKDIPTGLHKFIHKLEEGGNNGKGSGEEEDTED
jgi:hypothetical protein